MLNPAFYSNTSPRQASKPHLHRPRLDRLLLQALRKPLVMVIAGAGCGKTQAVYSFLRTFPSHTAWIQLSHQDNHPWHFWENFIQAASFNHEPLRSRLAQTGFPETKRQFHRYVAIPREVVNPGRRYVFVYDDFHLIQEEKVLRFIAQSVTTPFPTITSIFISRTEPPLGLEALEKRGLLARITEEDLRFSPDEVLAYYRLLHIPLDPSALAGLYRDTEGWAFAIHLVGLSIKNGAPAYNPSSLKTNCFPLIESEVFSVNSPALQRFLIKLSLINHYPPELLATLAENTGLMDELDRVNSFIRFDAYLNEYQIHHLFLEFLSAKQGELSEKERKEVYSKAARWCASHHMRLSAIAYFEKAAAYDELLDTIYALPLIVQDRIAQSLLDLMEKAPRSLYQALPTAWIVHTRMLVTLGRFDEALAELSRVIREYEALPPSPFSDRLLSGCYQSLGFISFITCLHTRRYDFAPHFKKAHAYYTRTPYRIAALRVAGLSSYVCRVGSPEPGEMEQFIEEAARSIPFLAATMDGCYYGMDDLARAELAYFQGKIEEAEVFARSALEKSRERAQYEIENRSILYLVRICLVQGDYPRIRELLKAWDAQLQITEYENRRIYYDIVTGWFYIQIGQPAKIAPWLKNDFEESELNSLLHGMETLVRTKWQVSERHYPVALGCLENRENHYSLGAFLLGKITMKTLEAICLKEIGDTPAALAALAAAYALAEPNGLDLCFVEIGKDARTLMDFALRNPECPIPQPWLKKIRRAASAHAKRLSEASLYFQEKRLPPPARGSGLSPRELAVLTGLSQGLTREEIAGDSGISINTVKSVIRSVYNKLGAVNRADAVRIAVSKGIVSNHE